MFILGLWVCFGCRLWSWVLEGYLKVNTERLKVEEDGKMVI